VVSTTVDRELYQLKIISGEADAAWCRTNFANINLYKKNEESVGYNTVPMKSPVSNEIAYTFNYNDKDPFRRKLYNDLKFRQAMSLALNREEINDAAFFGMAVITQATCLTSTSFFKKEWQDSFAQYDPNRANKLLDEVGLDKKDSDGWRLGPDGKPFDLIIEAGNLTGHYLSTVELTKEFWEDVGIKVLIKTMDGALLRTRRESTDHNILIRHIDDINEPALWSYTADRWGTPGLIGAWGWSLWMNAERDIKLGRQTLADFEGGVMPGEEPPEEIKELNSLVASWVNVPYMSPEYADIGTKIFDFHAENLYVIGTVGAAPYIYIAKKNIGNIPKDVWANFSWTGSPNMVGEQLFFKQP
jgi:peptide/nickel transport system substrate-binding protein